MVAATMGLVVIAAVLATGLQLQKQGYTEERRMRAQTTSRAAADMMSLDLQGAGVGIGSSHVNLGGTVVTSAISVVTGNPFTADATFALPAAPYAPATSDSLTILSGRAAEIVPMGCCGGGGASCSSCQFRTTSSGEACATLNLAASFDGQTIAFVNPESSVACLHTVTSVAADKFITTPGRSNVSPPAGDPCEESEKFWCTAGTYAIPIDTVVYRINWQPRAAGLPQRPRFQRDPDGPGPAPFEDILLDVEQMTVRLGVTDFTTGNLTFYPSGALPPLDKCTDALCPLVGGVITGPGIPAGNPTTLPPDVVAGGGLSNDQARIRQLERRIRVVEVTLLTRSPSVDRSMIEVSGAGFAMDPEGLPRDGYSRRRWTFEVAPRNFRLAGEP
jgi:type IV pilus assembly protein PilW